MTMVGRPISDAERRQRPFRRLIHYGLKMTVRRDIGGGDDITNTSKILEKRFTGLTVEQIGVEVAQMLLDQKNGIYTRQGRTVEEVLRREKTLEVAFASGEPAVLRDTVEQFIEGERCLAKL